MVERWSGALEVAFHRAQRYTSGQCQGVGGTKLEDVRIARSKL